MNKLSVGGVFCLPLPRFDQVAIGILAGLVLGANAGKVIAPKGGREA